jgi:hypothetical protein
MVSLLYPPRFYAPTVISTEAKRSGETPVLVLALAVAFAVAFSEN